jgi:transposase
LTPALIGGGCLVSNFRNEISFVQNVQNMKRKVAGMDKQPVEVQLFEMALDLRSPWKVVQCKFDPGKGLEVWLDFEWGAKFSDPETGVSCPVHDTIEKSWRHMNFWQHETHLHARVPRVVTPEGKIRLIEVPWARSGSGFTLMMEALVVLLSREMPVCEVAQMLKLHDTLIWRVIQHHVGKAHQRRNWASVKRILIDETSARRGHRYVTLFLDADTHELLFMVEGREGAALKEFYDEIVSHGGSPDQIEVICMDMSPAYQSGAKKYFPKAQVVFDFFHIMQLAGMAVDQVRKKLSASGAALVGSLWALRGNEQTRTEEQLELRRRLCTEYPKLGRAIMLRDMLQKVLRGECVEDICWWIWRARVSRLKPFKELADCIERHLDGIVGFMETRITNAAIEAVNGILQLAKRIARGFRSFSYFRAIAYLKASNLTLALPCL